ncbi:hypothetical protein EX30DRAFT_340080 [Ascodesmis nigricans]|uniref:2-hydroxyacyl-CoA lyase n=1 Tax=Ascodesmis nigricans TaxID=341454 RepID=A0A4V3SJ08_9PEZI|nr:hypothetical protein EX30DRAFT_340080 [Ascodesmis nigricans]
MVSTAPVTGAQHIANTLHSLGVTVVFGIVGIPVIEVAEALLAKGIRFVSFRNEQAASYAASAYGYLTGRPGICLVVGGPGVIHALAGVHNSMSNTAYPMLLLAGAAPSTDSGTKLSFQQLDAVAMLQSHTKLALRPPTLAQLSSDIRDAYRTAFYGRPGCTFVDLPADFIQGSLDERAPIISAIPAPPESLGDPARIDAIANGLRNAQRPLIIIGKGAAYSRSESHLRQFIETTKIPFLPTPQGKGLLPDGHPLDTSAARSTVLKSADFILVLGARINWILHFGTRFSPTATIAQVDISAEEFGRNSTSPDLSITGSIPAVITQLSTSPSLRNFSHPESSEWRQLITTSSTKNTKKSLQLAKTPTPAAARMTYHRVFYLLHHTLELLTKRENLLYVSEGANTMDISRSTIPVASPRSRLDAGTSATMGVGMGYAIAGAIAHPEKRVIAIEGDSAFGFSLAEVETMARYKLPVIILVMNNGGVYHGVADEEHEWEKVRTQGPGLPSTALGFETRYADVAVALGGRGWRVRTEAELQEAVRQAWAWREGPSVIDVVIDSGKGGKLSFAWLEKKEEKAKL